MAPLPSPVKRVEWRRAVFASALSTKAKVALLALLEYINDDGKAWPSKARLASDTGLHPETVRRAVAEAAAAGWVEVVERYHPNTGQSSNGYVLKGILTAASTPLHCELHPHHSQWTPHHSVQHPPPHSAVPPTTHSGANKTREQDQRTSSKQISPVIAEVWADLAGAAAVPDALGGYTLGQQESAALEVAGAVKAGRAANPVGLLLAVVRGLAGDAPRVDVATIRAALVPEPVAVEPMRPEWRRAVPKEYTPMTPEQKAEAKAALKAMGEMLGVTA